MKNLLRALSYFWPDASRLTLVLFLMLISVGLNVLKPWPLAVIVDSVLGTKPAPGWLPRADVAQISSVTAHQNKSLWLALLSLAIFALHLGQGGFAALQNFLSIRISLRGLTRIRAQLFERLQKLTMRFHQRAASGDLIYRASVDTYAFQNLFQQGLMTLSAAGLSLVLMIVVMAQINLPLTLAALGLVPMLLIVIRVFSRRMTAAASAAQQADSLVSTHVQQSIAAMPLIQSYTREDQERSTFLERAERAQTRRSSQHRTELFYWFVITILFGLGTAAMTWLGAREVWLGKLSVGELLVFISYLALLYEPLNQLSHVGATVTGASAGTNRVFEILDTDDEIKESAQARPLHRHSPTEAPSDAVELRGAIEFDQVTFAYETGRETLSDVSFSLQAGEALAIIGPSGAGKSTLLNLIPRLADPQSGAIRLDGVDLRDLRLRDLRENIALVPQQPVILCGSIAANIGYGKEGATMAEIEQAARAANADRFIEALPQKYQTPIGDGAARLSVGEQQRINLARAFLKNAPILLLDEPTSALDAESETLIIESLKSLMHGRTTLIVAHRLKTIAQAQKILVLENGRVTEVGTREELFSRPSYFARVLGANRPVPNEPSKP